MTRHRSVPSACTIVLSLLMIGAPAAAQIDLTGRWRVVLDDQTFDADQELDLVFTQTGGVLTSNLGWAGTIDPATGVFHLETLRECGAPIADPDPRPVTIDGTVDPGGDSFGGTFADYIRPTRSCLSIAGPATGSRVQFTGCGNDVLDPGEQCDDGPGGGPCCGADCMLTPAGTVCGTDPASCFDARCTVGGQCLLDLTSQPNGDGDLVADRCDPCTGGPPIDPSRLDVVDVAGEPGKGRVKLRGSIALASAADVDPVADGARIRILDTALTVLLDADVPAGPYDRDTKTGWRVRKSGWTFRAPAGGPNTVDRVTLKADGSGAGTIGVRLRGTLPPSTPILPLTLTVVLDPPFAMTGRCGETRYAAPAGACAANGSGRRSCRSGAR